MTQPTRRGPLCHVEYLGDGNAVFRFTCGAELLVPVDDVEAELKLVRAEHADNDGWQMAAPIRSAESHD